MSSNLSDNKSSPWLTVCGAKNTELEDLLSERLTQRRNAGFFSLDNQKGVEQASFVAVKGAFSTSPERSELLRKLCQIYAVDIKPLDISSHRKFIGPFIVAVKKVLFRVVRPLIGPALVQQRNFNAAAIYLLTDLCNEMRQDTPDAFKRADLN